MQQQIGTFVPNHPTTENHEEIHEKPSTFRDEGGQFVEGTAPGPGRPPKHQKPEAHARTQPNYDHELIEKPSPIGSNTAPMSQTMTHCDFCPDVPISRVGWRVNAPPL